MLIKPQIAELSTSFRYTFIAFVEHDATFVTSSDAERELDHLTQNVFNLFKPKQQSGVAQQLEWNDVFSKTFSMKKCINQYTRNML